METRPDIKAIELEMAYTPYSGSCKDPLLPTAFDERACRRAAGHEDNVHASGFTENGSFIMWSSVTERHPGCAWGNEGWD
jgi:hypothetical protein